MHDVISDCEIPLFWIARYIQ